MYADTVTGSMRAAISETNRRRKIQMEYNKANGIIPKTIVKDVRDVIEIGKAAERVGTSVKKNADGTPKRMSSKERDRLIEELTAQMKRAAKNLEFEQAAYIRDKIAEIRKQ